MNGQAPPRPTPTSPGGHTADGLSPSPALAARLEGMIKLFSSKVRYHEGIASIGPEYSADAKAGAVYAQHIEDLRALLQAAPQQPADPGERERLKADPVEMLAEALYNLCPFGEQPTDLDGRPISPGGVIYWSKMDEYAPDEAAKIRARAAALADPDRADPGEVARLTDDEIASIAPGEWRKGGDGFCELVIKADPQQPAAEASEGVVERLTIRALALRSLASSPRKRADANLDEIAIALIQRLEARLSALQARGQEMRDMFDRPFDDEDDPRLEVACVLTRSEAQAVLEHRGDIVAALAPGQAGGVGITNQDRVREFHETFGVPVLASPRIPLDRVELRLNILDEERRELGEAIEASDIVEVADALTDMAYLIYGTALEFGIDLNACFAEVHRSNMSKLGEDGKPIYREDGKVMKGPNYSRPDLRAVLAPLPDQGEEG